MSLFHEASQTEDILRKTNNKTPVKKNAIHKNIMTSLESLNNPDCKILDLLNYLHCFDSEDLPCSSIFVSKFL